MLTERPLFRYVRAFIIVVLFLGLISAVVATAAAVAQYDDIPDWIAPADFFHTLKTASVEHPPSSIPVSPEEIQPYYAKKVVYLSFDDGPDPVVTPRILQILKQYAVPATFFVIGTQTEAYPELLRQINTEGHAIGNHSYNHRYKELYQSPSAYIDQLRKCDALIAAITGVKPLISRAPGGTAGSFTSEYWSALKREGYRDVGWNINSVDASSARATQITANVIAQAQKNEFLWSHAIVLMHDGRNHTETAAALPSIIEYFKNEGFEFRRIDLSTPPAW